MRGSGLWMNREQDDPGIQPNDPSPTTTSVTIVLKHSVPRYNVLISILDAAALCLIGMNVILMMTPAALHRLSFAGEDSPRFLRIGSILVTIGPAFLAAGISAELMWFS